MKVFVSSVIQGFEDYREAAAAAIESLGYEAVRAEDFAASDDTPQQACLRGVRDSDVTIVLLGARYGYIQSTGRSATHDEYLEARDHSRVLALVQEGVEREASQGEFVREVQDWESGVYTDGFSTPSELRDAVTRNLHRLVVAGLDTVADRGALHDRALQVARTRPAGVTGSFPSLVVAVAIGPEMQAISPSRLRGDIAAEVQEAAMFGEYPVLDRSAATEANVAEGELTLIQDHAQIWLDDRGAIRVSTTAARSGSWTQIPGLSVMIEEHVAAQIGVSLQFIGQTLDRIDPVLRMPDTAVVAGVLDGSYLAWRTEEEHRLNPNSVQINHGINPVVLVPEDSLVVRRGALAGGGVVEITRDLTVLLGDKFRAR